MKKINQVVQAVSEVLRKKSFWLPESIAKKVEEEKEKRGWKSESALMTHIITSFFKK